MTQLVTLSRAGLHRAASVGFDRNIQSLFRGDKHTQGARKWDGWSMHVEGAAGELAVATHLGVDWLGSVNAFHDPDVGPFEVRTSRRRDLRIDERDKDDRIYIAVHGLAPHFEILGWMLCRNCKQNRWWAKKNPGRAYAYWVPERELNPIEDLPSWV